MVRLKHRYVLAEVKFADPKKFYHVNPHRVIDEITGIVTKVHGISGLAGVKIGLHVKYLNEYSKLVLIRVRSQYHQKLLSALPFIKTMPVKMPGVKARSAPEGVACFLNTICVTSTIKDAQKRIRTYGKRTMDRLLSECKTEEERTKVRKVFAEHSQPEEMEVDEEELEDEKEEEENGK